MLCPKHNLVFTFMLGYVCSATDVNIITLSNCPYLSLSSHTHFDLSCFFVLISLFIRWQHWPGPLFHSWKRHGFVGKTITNHWRPQQQQTQLHFKRVLRLLICHNFWRETDDTGQGQNIVVRMCWTTTNSDSSFLPYVQYI